MSHDFVMTNADTDSISFRKSDGSPITKEEQESLLSELKQIMPSMIEYEDDGYYSTILVVKAKNYILHKHGDTKYKYKGSGIKDSKKEIALREMLDELIDDIIKNEGTSVISIYEKYIKEVKNIQDISRWTTKKTFSKKVQQSDRTNETKIMDAIKHLDPREGDKFMLYTADGGMVQDTKKGELVFLKNGEPKMVKSSILKVQEEWDNDYDLTHYLKRVYSTISILKNIIDMDKIIKYHNKCNASKLDLL